MPDDFDSILCFSTSHVPMTVGSVTRTWPSGTAFRMYHCRIQLLLLEGQKLEAVIQDGPSVAS